jgi:diamine N-acetyltransferase
MPSIIKATIKDLPVLAEIGRQSFIESHGHSAPVKDIDEFVAIRFNENNLAIELSDPSTIFHIIYQDDEPAGYSKIMLNTGHPDIQIPNLTKLERIFLLQQYYGTSLGNQLFRFILDLSKSYQQSGMWLYAWTENTRALNFYKKNGFEVIGDYQYKISATHSNPNYRMLLKY